jgi:hypothetical protein
MHGVTPAGCARLMRQLLVMAALAFFATVSPANAGVLKTCYDRGYEDLKAKGVHCSTAQRVYRTSLKAAQRAGGASVTRFRFARLRWSCRASNPPAVPFYTWKCGGTGNRVVQYRWKSGE